MKGTDRRLALAYAFGMLNGSKKRISLGEINSEWDNFVLTIADRNDPNLNNSYSLYYDGPFGKDKWFSRVMTIHEGFDLDHTIHLLMQAIECLKSEHKDP